jgi:hypothetical protein
MNMPGPVVGVFGGHEDRRLSGLVVDFDQDLARPRTVAHPDCKGPLPWSQALVTSSVVTSNPSAR